MRSRMDLENGSQTITSIGQRRQSTLRSGQPSVGVLSSKTVKVDFWGVWRSRGCGLGWGNKLGDGDVGKKGLGSVGVGGWGLGSVGLGVRGWCGKNGGGRGGMRGKDVMMERLGRG
ncbi:unnamed protein product [Prunus armeniaca]|uniref:Uncharacterized protein n=1 Tax=Prunus armeniaca TaxID=36596 RepID=A0A6J5UPA7_PRUAR|nr:unnamed protein product [Prunus armeniaca]